MNENNDITEDEILVTMPEQEIDTLADVTTEPLDDEKALDGLSGLVKKVFPFATGLIASSFLEAPGSIWKVLESTGNIAKKFIDDNLTGKDKTISSSLSIDYGYPDSIIEIQERIQAENTGLGYAFYMFLILYKGYIELFGTVTLTKSRLLQEVNKDTPIQLPDVNVIFSALLKQTNYKDEAYEFLARHGISKTAQNIFWDGIKQLPDINTLFQNLWRGKINTSRFNQYLAKQGYDAAEQTLFNNLADRIPPIQDLIRFSVREAFSEELSAKYEHDVEFPTEFADWSKKQGFPEHWALKYWRSHWELPSIQMVFEMLHRKVIKPNGKQFNKDDMYDLLRMADYPRFWRNLLTQISYRVITRVDARRMYDLGVWDNLPDMTPEEKVKEVYEKQGYNSEDAQYMTDFTVQYTEQKRRAFTTAGLKKLRKYGIISEDIFREKLSDIRIRSDEIDYLVDELNYELEDKKLDSFMNYAKAMYLNQRWNQSQVQLEMTKVGLHVSEPDNLFEAWEYDRLSKRRVLTKGDIQRLLEKGIIKTRQDAIARFLDLGYDQQSSEFLTDEMVDFTLGEK